MTQRRTQKPQHARTRRARAQQPPQSTRVTVSVHDLPRARQPVDRDRYARSVRIAYLVILFAAVLFVLALAGVL